MSSAHAAGGEGTAGDHGVPAFAYRFEHYDTLTSWHVWQCPYCDHTLKYADGQEDVVEMAVASHLTRWHSGQLRFLTGVRA